MSYSYRIDNVDVKVLPVNNYSATIAVLATNGGKSTSGSRRGKRLTPARSPKKRGPLQAMPVMARAMVEKLA